MKCPECNKKHTSGRPLRACLQRARSAYAYASLACEEPLYSTVAQRLEAMKKYVISVERGA